MNLRREYLRWFQSAPTWLCYAVRDQNILDGSERVTGKRTIVNLLPRPGRTPGSRNVTCRPNTLSMPETGRVNPQSDADQPEESSLPRHGHSSETLAEWTQRKIFWSWYDRNH